MMVEGSKLFPDSIGCTTWEYITRLACSEFTEEKWLQLKVDGAQLISSEAGNVHPSHLKSPT